MNDDPKPGHISLEHYSGKNNTQRVSLYNRSEEIRSITVITSKETGSDFMAPTLLLISHFERESKMVETLLKTEFPVTTTLFSDLNTRYLTLFKANATSMQNASIFKQRRKNHFVSRMDTLKELLISILTAIDTNSETALRDNIATWVDKSFAPRATKSTLKKILKDICSKYNIKPVSKRDLSESLESGAASQKSIALLSDHLHDAQENLRIDPEQKISNLMVDLQSLKSNYDSSRTEIQEVRETNTHLQMRQEKQEETIKGLLVLVVSFLGKEHPDVKKLLTNQNTPPVSRQDIPPGQFQGSGSDAGNYTGPATQKRSTSAYDKNIKGARILNNNLMMTTFPHGLVIGTAVSDGNCLFDSVAQLMNDGRDRNAMRLLAVNYMRNNSKQFVKHFDGGQKALNARIANMKQDRTHGDEYEVQALAFALRRQIIVISNNNPMPRAGDGNHPILFLHHSSSDVNGVQYGHYQPVRLEAEADINVIMKEIYPMATNSM